MVEALAVIGGVAAVTQLINYGYSSKSTAFKLSSKIRHRSQTVEDWLTYSRTMTGLLDDIEEQALTCTPNVVQLLKQCRKDANRLCLLLQTFGMDLPLQKRSSLSDSMFVVLKGEKVERLISSYRDNYTWLTHAV